MCSGVVGNPANTNCLVTMSMRQRSRATVSQHDTVGSQPGCGAAGDESRRLGEDVSRMTIWGNHSSTQYRMRSTPGLPAGPHPGDRDDAWIKEMFIPWCRSEGRPSSRLAGRAAPPVRPALSSARQSWYHGPRRTIG